MIFEFPNVTFFLNIECKNTVYTSPFPYQKCYQLSNGSFFLLILSSLGSYNVIILQKYLTSSLQQPTSLHLQNNTFLLLQKYQKFSLAPLHFCSLHNQTSPMNDWPSLSLNASALWLTTVWLLIPSSPETPILEGQQQCPDHQSNCFSFSLTFLRNRTCLSLPWDCIRGSSKPLFP